MIDLMDDFHIQDIRMDCKVGFYMKWTVQKVAVFLVTNDIAKSSSVKTLLSRGHKPHEHTFCRLS